MAKINQILNVVDSIMKVLVTVLNNIICPKLGYGYASIRDFFLYACMLTRNIFSPRTPSSGLSVTVFYYFLIFFCLFLGLSVTVTSRLSSFYATEYVYFAIAHIFH